MLVEQRLQWLAKFKEGFRPSSSVLEDYRKHRLSNSWRASKGIEELCEYIIYLESINER
jgi:hypothetical protein